MLDVSLVEGDKNVLPEALMPAGEVERLRIRA